jgi:hypothetical protein
MKTKLTETKSKSAIGRGRQLFSQGGVFRSGHSDLLQRIGTKPLYVRWL